MLIKILEVRDEGTFIPLLCIDMNDPGHPAQRYYLRRCGYPLRLGEPNIAVTNLNMSGGPASNDPFFWQNRTLHEAHNYILSHWAELQDGDVIDVQFILGEKSDKKISERLGERL
jgi:hypothetical protein